MQTSKLQIQINTKLLKSYTDYYKGVGVVVVATCNDKSDSNKSIFFYLPMFYVFLQTVSLKTDIFIFHF